MTTCRTHFMFVAMRPRFNKQWLGPKGAIAMSMRLASPTISFTPPKRNSLTHIPGDEGWPVIGKTLDVLADPKGQIERQAAKYGLVYRSHIFGETSVVLLGPDANELVLFDQAKQFSSTHGWGRILGLLFPRGLMLLDFDEHRLHRRALSVAFKSGPMKSYLAELDISGFDPKAPPPKTPAFWDIVDAGRAPEDAEADRAQGRM